MASGLRSANSGHIDRYDEYKTAPELRSIEKVNRIANKRRILLFNQTVHVQITWTERFKHQYDHKFSKPEHLACEAKAKEWRYNLITRSDYGTGILHVRSHLFWNFQES